MKGGWCGAQETRNVKNLSALLNISAFATRSSKITIVVFDILSSRVKSAGLFGSIVI